MADSHEFKRDIIASRFELQTGGPRVCFRDDPSVALALPAGSLCRNLKCLITPAQLPATQLTVVITPPTHSTLPCIGATVNQNGNQDAIARL
jgi:hypothetical protein